ILGAIAANLSRTDHVVMVKLLLHQIAKTKILLRLAGLRCRAMAATIPERNPVRNPTMIGLLQAGSAFRITRLVIRSSMEAAPEIQSTRNEATLVLSSN